MQTSVVVAWGLAALGMVMGPIVLAVWFQRRYDIQWRVFAYGAAVFLLFQMLTRIPVVLILNNLLGPSLQSTGPLILYLASLGLTAGLFESVGRWVGYKWWFRRRVAYNWHNGVAYGIGHGGIESALLIGLNSAASLWQAIQIAGASVEELQAAVPVEAMNQIMAARNQFLALAWYEPMWGLFERAFALPFHVALSLLVLMAFVQGRIRWLWLAVLIHGFVDFSAVAMVQVLGLPGWAVELYLALWAGLSVWVIVRLKGALGAGEGTVAPVGDRPAAA